MELSDKYGIADQDSLLSRKVRNSRKNQPKRIKANASDELEWEEIRKERLLVKSKEKSISKSKKFHSAPDFAELEASAVTTPLKPFARLSKKLSFSGQRSLSPSNYFPPKSESTKTIHSPYFRELFKSPKASEHELNNMREPGVPELEDVRQELKYTAFTDDTATCSSLSANSSSSDDDNEEGEDQETSPERPLVIKKEKKKRKKMISLYSTFFARLYLESASTSSRDTPEPRNRQQVDAGDYLDPDNEDIWPALPQKSKKSKKVITSPKSDEKKKISNLLSSTSSPFLHRLFASASTEQRKMQKSAGSRRPPVHAKSATNLHKKSFSIDQYIKHTLQGHGKRSSPGGVHASKSADSVGLSLDATAALGEIAFTLKSPKSSTTPKMFKGTFPGIFEGPSSSSGDDYRLHFGASTDDVSLLRYSPVVQQMEGLTSPQGSMEEFPPELVEELLNTTRRATGVLKSSSYNSLPNIITSPAKLTLRHPKALSAAGAFQMTLNSELLSPSVEALKRPQSADAFYRFRSPELHVTSPPTAAVSPLGIAMPSVSEVVDPVPVVERLYAYYFSKGYDARNGNESQPSSPQRKKRWDDPDTESDEEDLTAHEKQLPHQFHLGVLYNICYQVGYGPHHLEKHIPLSLSWKSIMERNLDKLEFMMQKDTLPVDLLWFQSQVLPTFFRGVLPPDVRLYRPVDSTPVNKLFQLFIRPGFVYEACQQLYHEDERFPSMKLSLLKLLFKKSEWMEMWMGINRELSGNMVTDKFIIERFMNQVLLLVNDNSCSFTGLTHCDNQHIRMSTVNSLAHVTYLRYIRCRRTYQNSNALEIDTNYLAKRGYGDHMFEDVQLGQEAQEHSYPSPSTQENQQFLRSLAQAQSLDAISFGSEERQPYKVRDTEQCMMEFLQYVLTVEIHEIQCVFIHLNQIYGSSQAANSASSSPYLQVKNPRLYESYFEFLAQQLKDAERKVGPVVASFLYVLYSYGYKLGNVSELTEQPALLNDLLVVLEYILLWTKLIGQVRIFFETLCVACQFEIPWTPMTVTTLGGPLSDQEETLPAGSEERKIPLVHRVSKHIMQQIALHWTKKQVCNYAQDLAYLRVLETILASYQPLEVAKRPASESPLPSPIGSKLKAADISIKLLRKIVTGFLPSHHFKVANQAICCIQNMQILLTFAFPPHDRHAPHQEVMLEHTPSFFNLSIDEGSSSASPIGGDRKKYLLGLDAETREDLLNTLLETLRGNRLHWHPMIQQASALALDYILEHLQHFEDNADGEEGSY